MGTQTMMSNRLVARHSNRRQPDVCIVIEDEYTIETVREWASWCASVSLCDRARMSCEQLILCVWMSCADRLWALQICEQYKNTYPITDANTDHSWTCRHRDMQWDERQKKSHALTKQIIICFFHSTRIPTLRRIAFVCTLGDEWQTVNRKNPFDDLAHRGSTKSVECEIYAVERILEKVCDETIIVRFIHRMS